MSRRGAPGVWSKGWTVMVDVSFLACISDEHDQTVLQLRRRHGRQK
jgi:hypothetical protein